MAVRVVPTELGPPAFSALAAEVRAAKHGEPLRPCTVVVPSNSLGVSVRRRLASGEAGPVCGDRPGLVGVTFLTVYRLAELLAAPALAAQGRRPVSTPVVLAAIRRELHEDAGVFAEVADHPATEVALLRTYRELRELGTAELDATATTSSRAADVVRVARGVHERLRTGWYDEADLMAAAREVVAASPAALEPFGTVVLHLPGDATPTATALLSGVADAGDLVVVAGRSGSGHADAPVDRLLTRLGLSVPEVTVEEPTATGLSHAADADDEVREAVRRLVAAVHGEQPLRLERMAVLYSSADPYGPLLAEHLARAGLRHQGFVGRPLGHSLVGRALRSSLRHSLASDPVRRDLVISDLASVPWWSRDRGGAVPAARWEQLSRDLGVAGGLERWRSATTAAVAEIEGRADALAAAVEAGEASAGRLERDVRRREDLLALLAHVEAEARELRSLRTATTWAELVERCRTRLRRVRLPRPGADPGLVEQRAAEAVDRLLDAARGMDAIGEPVSAATLLQFLEVELERPTRRGGLGDGVLVGPLSAAVGLDLDLVVLVGLAEGDLPGRAAEDSLLLDSERVAAGDALQPSRTRSQRRHAEFLHAVAAGRQAVLCWPRGDLRRSAQRLPSRWVVDQARRLGGDHDTRWSAVGADDLERLEPRPRWMSECPSFAGGLRSVEIPTDPQEYRLAAAARLGRVDVGSAGFDDPLLARSIQLLAARASDHLTRFDGLLPRGLVPSPIAADGPVAPTRLEMWRRCPHHFLLFGVLGVDEVEEPADLLEINPLERGSLLHGILEDWLAERLADPPAPSEPWGTADRDRLVEIATDHFARARARGVTGRDLLWEIEQDRLLRLLQATVDRDDRRRAGGGLVPVGVELSFGRDHPVCIPLGGGRSLALRGRVDRVDRAADGSFVVVDYKSGKSTNQRAFDPDDPTAGGRQLQLPLYSEAVRQVLGGTLDGARAEYWYLSDQGVRGLSTGPETLAEAVEVVGRLVDLMDAGVYVPLPKEPDTSPFVECASCDPDGLGTGDGHRRWRRKRLDPAVATLVELIDGPSVEEVAP